MPFVNPDYAASVAECYQRVTEKRLLRRHDLFEQDGLSAHHDLKVLSSVQHKDGIAADWPSWVPDWSQKKRGGNTFRPFSFSPFPCPKPAVVSMQQCAARTCICIDGFAVDVIGQIHTRHGDSGESKDLRRLFSSHQALLRDLSSIHSTGSLACTFGETGSFGYQEK